MSLMTLSGAGSGLLSIGVRKAAVLLIQMGKERAAQVMAHLSDAEVEAMLKALKQHCGAGGTLDGRTVEVQGDHRDRVRAYLEGRGLNVKLAGG